MKRRVFFITFILTMILCVTTLYATDANPNNGYSFKIDYTGNIIEGEEKSATVILEGNNATAYTNVQIKVELVSGPSDPIILATDSNGATHNIIELGHWGPESGFAVGGTFRNETPVKATYKDAGTYVIKLSLVDKTKNDDVIVSQEFTQTVYESNPATNEMENGIANEMANNIVEEIPQTGVSIWTYAAIILVIAVAIYLSSIVIKRKK